MATATARSGVPGALAICSAGICPRRVQEVTRSYSLNRVLFSKGHKKRPTSQLGSRPFSENRASRRYFLLAAGFLAGAAGAAGFLAGAAGAAGFLAGAAGAAGFLAGAAFFGAAFFTTGFLSALVFLRF